MILTEYFAQPTSPMEHSPVGELMIKILEKFPGISLEGARDKALVMLADAAGRRIYRTPRVYSAEEQLARVESFKRLRNTPGTQVSGGTGQQAA